MPPLCKFLPDNFGLICQTACAKVLLRTCRLTHARQSYTWLDWLCVVLPMMRWVRTYKLKEYLLVRPSGRSGVPLHCCQPYGTASSRGLSLWSSWGVGWEASSKGGAAAWCGKSLGGPPSQPKAHALHECWI